MTATGQNLMAADTTLRPRLQETVAILDVPLGDTSRTSSNRHCGGTQHGPVPGGRVLRLEHPRNCDDVSRTIEE